MRQDIGEHHITDAELKLMLKIGDPGPEEKYEGKEVDFTQFMHIMEMAGLVEPEFSGVDSKATPTGGKPDGEFAMGMVNAGGTAAQTNTVGGGTNEQGPYQGNW